MFGYLSGHLQELSGGSCRGRLFIGFLVFPARGKSTGGVQCHHPALKCCLGCAVLAERSEVVWMGFYHLIPAQGGRFNFMLVAPVVHLTLDAQILMHHHQGTRWGHQNPFPWGFSASLLRSPGALCRWAPAPVSAGAEAHRTTQAQGDWENFADFPAENVAGHSKHVELSVPGILQSPLAE